MLKVPNARNRLFCPGPTPVSAAAAHAGLNTDLYHRAPEFRRHFLRTRTLLKDFFDSAEDPLILTASGTGALEAALVNLTEPGDQVLVVNGGKFGERWTKLAQNYQCEPHEIQLEWGTAPSPQQIVDRLKKAPKCKALFLQANETSTGVAFPVEEIARSARMVAPELLIVVDAVSALVAHHVKLKSWDLDCIVAGSQKGFGVPPGLAFVSLSPRAWTRLSSRSRFYFDLARERAAQAEGQTAWTPATTLVLSLEAALTQLHEIGVDGAVAHHRKMAEACRQAAYGLGMELFSQSHHSQAVTAIRLPPQLDSSQLVKVCRDKFGAVFAGGQDQAKGKILRIGHLGIFDQFDLLTAISAFEFGLREIGHRHELGSGVKAAMASMVAS